MYVKPHNKEAYENIKKGFLSKNRVATVCATGTGKSYQALQLIQENLSARFLYVTSLTSIKHHFLSLCRQELGYEDISVCIYDELSDTELLSHWDFIILDEFHRCGAHTWGKKITILLSNNPQAKVLGLSATPIRYLDNMRNMSDELFDGNVVYELSLAKAIAKGILPIPEYISCLYSLEAINKKISSFETKLKTTKYINNRNEISKRINEVKKIVASSPDAPTVLKANIHDKIGHYIVFCSDIEHLKKMEQEAPVIFEGINSITIYTVYSGKKDNDDTISNFLSDTSNTLKLLFAVNMLTEGIHADNISGVIFLRPTASPNVYLQQMGRALSSGKSTRPQIIDMVNNTDCLRLSVNLANEVNHIIEQSFDEGNKDISFSITDYVRQIGLLLAEIESSLFWDWDDWIEILKIYYETNHNIEITRFFETEEGYRLGDWLHGQRQLYKKNALPQAHIDTLNELGMIWDPWDSLWEKGFAKAKEFYEINGSLRLPNSYVCDDGFKLGAWIYNKRQNYKNGILSKEHIEALNQLGMYWDVYSEQWEEAFAEASEYYHKNGDLRIPRQFTTDNGLKLGQWVSERRRDYKDRVLSTEQIDKLNSIGMIWDVTQYAWEKGISEARIFYSDFGHLIVPRNYVSNGFKLGSWISKMRSSYKSGLLSPDQIEALNDIEMVWNRQDIRTRITFKALNACEIDSSLQYIEGATQKITVNKYERDHKARKACIDFYKKKDGEIKCQACGFSFGDYYGEECNMLIEIHHLRPLSEIHAEYKVDPKVDLIPLCSNCHYVIHAKCNGSYDALIKLLKSEKNQLD